MQNEWRSNSQENGDRIGDRRNTGGGRSDSPWRGSWLSTPVTVMATARRTMLVRTAAPLTLRAMVPAVGTTRPAMTSPGLTHHAIPRSARRTAADRRHFGRTSSRAADELRRFTHTHTTMEIENENACHEISWRPWARCRACDDCRHVIVRATARLQLHSPIRHLRCADRAVLLTATEAKPTDWYKEPGTPGSFKGRRARASTRGHSAAKAPPIPRGAGAGRGAIPRTSSSSIPMNETPHFAAF